jgi:hypothetical protein
MRALCAALLVLCGVRSVLAADLKDVVAERLNEPPEYLLMNLPPRAGVYPGAIFTYDMRVPIQRVTSDDPSLQRGEPTSIMATELVDLGAGVGAAVARIVSLDANVSHVATVRIAFPDTRAVDMDLGELEKRVKQSAEAIDAIKRGQIPLVVVKSFEGTFEVTLTKKSDATAEAWANVRQAAANVSLHATATTGDQLTYKIDKPIVYAFSTMKADFDPTSLANGQIRLSLSKAPAQLFAWREELGSTELALAAAASDPDFIGKLAVKYPTVWADAMRRYDVNNDRTYVTVPDEGAGEDVKGDRFIQLPYRPDGGSGNSQQRMNAE